MPENMLARCPLRVLAPESVRRIHDEVIAMLHTVGVRIDSTEALDLLAGYGVRCDRRLLRAYPGEAHIRRALDTVTRSYCLHGRHPENSRPLRICGTTTHTVSGGAALRLYSNGEYRAVSEDDVINAAVLHEKLDHIDILINVVEPPAMLKDALYPTMAAIQFCYSSKPLLLQVSGRRDLAMIIRMAAMVAGSEKNLRAKPLFMTGINSEPPLSITRDGAEVLMDAARAGIPVSLGVYVMMGSTGPLHIAGSLIQRTAMVLTGLLLTQAAQPGSIYDFTCHSGACDLKNGDAVTMSPQVIQLVAASIQIGRHYGLVTHGLACTEARAPDAQAAAERALALMTSVMAGASLISHGTSCMAGMELADYAQSVIDNDLAGYVMSLASAIPMDGLDEALAAVRDIADDPLYAGLGFMAHPHTAGLCRQQAEGLKVFTTGQLSRWLNGKRESVYEKAGQLARKLMAERREFVSPDLKKELFKLAKEE